MIQIHQITHFYLVNHNNRDLHKFLTQYVDKVILYQIRFDNREA